MKRNRGGRIWSSIFMVQSACIVMMSQPGWTEEPGVINPEQLQAAARNT